MRVLILHASAGAGHRRAAEALQKGFLSENSKAEVKVCDILDFTPAVFRRTYAKGYLDVVRKAPELWGFMYAQSDRKALIPWRRKVRSFVNQVNTPPFVRFYEEFNPDAVVCTHFMPLELLSTRMRRGKLATPLFCVVTDFAVHSLWILEGVQTYYVATEEAKRQLVRRGQPEGQVKVTGIPIDPVFSERTPRDEARRQLGLPGDMPFVLVLSGGFGVGPTAELLRALGTADLNCRILVVAGANEEMRQQALVISKQVRTPVTVFGFVNNIHALMDASDIIISKPGGLTTSEILAKGKPLIIIDPIPGQEQRNCEYLLEAGAAARLFDVEDAGFKVQSLLTDRKRLTQMAKNAARIGSPHAARTIARDIMGRM